MSSGIAVADEVKDVYKDMKTKKSNAFAIFKISDDKARIVVDYVSQEGESFERFTELMLSAKDECRYAVYDVTDPNNDKNSKLLFILWASDEAKIKPKMIYASSKANCLKSLEGQSKEYQMNDDSDISWEKFVEAAYKK